MKLKSTIRIAAFAFALAAVAPGSAYGQSPTADPPALPAGMDLSKMFNPIPADDVPGAIALRPPVRKAAAEQWEQMTFGGSSNRNIRNVVNPTLTPVLPDPAKATGVAVIIAPGGGFRGLAIDHEGFQVARWLAERGIAAFVLKYRLVPTPRDAATYMQSVMAEIGKRAPEDTFQRPYARGAGRCPGRNSPGSPAFGGMGHRARQIRLRRLFGRRSNDAGRRPGRRSRRTARFHRADLSADGVPPDSRRCPADVSGNFTR